MRATILTTLVLAGAALAPGAELVPGLDDPDPRERRKAVGRLEALPGRAALGALVNALADEAGCVRERAAAVLARREDDGERDLLLLAARRDRRPIVREELAGVLARWTGADVRAWMADGLRDRSPVVREIAARALGDGAGPEEIRALGDLLADRHPGPRIAALESLDRLDPRGSPVRALARLGDADPEVRVAAVLVLARRTGPGVDRALVERLDDPAWSVKVATARVLASIRLTSSIEPLIGALEREEGRVREEIHRALAAVTGVGLPDDPARWRAWWSRVAESFEIPPRPARAPARDSDSAVSYHSIPVTSRRVTFVIDASRSMLQPAGAKEGPSRRELALTELERTLRRLPRGTSFNLVLFGREVVRWQPRARPVCRRAVRDALRLAGRMPPGGWTDLHGALTAALADPTVDTVFVLTDGAPSAGRHTSRRALMGAIERMNRYRLARIHTVGFGERRIGKRWRGFLADLARAHDGVHVAR